MDMPGITEFDKGDEVVADIGKGPESLYVNVGAMPQHEQYSVMARDPVTQEEHELDEDDILGTDPVDVPGARPDGRPPARFE